MASITKHLSGMDFPADKEGLVEHARGQGAGEDVIQAIRDMPQDSYGSMADVMKAFGKE